MIIEISVGVVSLAVTVLIIFLIRSLVTLTKTMNSVNETLHDLKGKVEEAVGESTNAFKETRLLVEDLRVKSQQTEELFHSVSEVGKTFQQVSTSLVRHAEKHKDRLSNIIAILGAGMEFARQWRNERLDQVQEKEVKADE
ncbi:DUF948 domain-containing protein [Paenactinomyces guangxiensis]|uniref:DUF948 domain-containing protein n=1 Tax=Paenactinomyces guangxiensis TaxID=1490290 RepID=A0A7W1WN54_9BACL|nr:DUF948 domain-containing protein [Paenactinomyces guangxiensis]MBA4492823.1 DUF948 domain-containing protein [Paenactinomyces guangxiensis]MBH8590328.1 DUF948 domain-containing protein [Paenactinomyces guangxiensis]